MLYEVITQVFLEGVVVVMSPDAACSEVELAAAWVAADFELSYNFV